MAIYVLPQSRVFQLIESAVSVTDFRAHAFIIGGHATLYRYAQADEKVQISIGHYDHVGTNIDGEYKTMYSWPLKPTGSKIDPSYTKLFIDNALLRYFHDTSEDIVKTATNKVRYPTVAFADNPVDPDTYPKDATLKDRGVLVGDIVKVKAFDGDSNEYNLCTYVRDIEGDDVAASVGAAAASVNNQATVTLTANTTADGGNSGTVVMSAVSGASYAGFQDGDVSETYTVTVTQASTGGNYATARLRVRSASGHDDADDVVPSESPTTTALGARGATMTFADGSGANFTVDDEWTVVVRQAFTAPVATSAGTYTGTKNRTYIVEVTTGGTSGGSSLDDPYITVTAQDGSDSSGPTRVAAVSTNYPVGAFGVLVQFNQTKLRRGDRYTIAAVAAKEGSMKTLVLAHPINSAVPLNDAAVSKIQLSLYIKKNLEVTEQHVDVGGQYNWEQSNTEFGVFAGIYAFDDSWTDAGELEALPVISDATCAAYNSMYLEYRAWRSDLTSSIGTLSLLSELDALVSGPLTPDNPLKYGLFKALENNNGQPIRYLAVADPDDTADWTEALAAAEERNDIYNLVPLTTNRTVQELVEAHIESMSNEEQNRWRAGIFSIVNSTKLALVNAALSSDEEVVLATTEDDGATSGTQYTVLRLTSDNAELIAAGVRAGDIVRYLYTSDAWGNESYTEFTIDEVLTEHTVRLATGTDTEQNLPIRVEFWRNLTKTEQSEQLAVQAGSWGNDRIVVIWPDEVSSGGVTFPGYFLCCAIAGLISGVAPHQGLTNVEISGVDDVSRTTSYFNRSQLDHMALNGVWVVTQDPSSGEVYTRHALTTGDYEELLRREEMCRRNRDLISYRFQTRYAPYIGKTNATPSMLDILEAETMAEIQYLRRAFYTPELGGQIIDAEITDIHISPVFKDRVIIQVRINQPSPLNNVDSYLTFFV